MSETIRAAAAIERQEIAEAKLAALKEAFAAYRDDIDRRFEESDLRYQQRFDAQQKALQDALQAAKEAVNTALASADRAVVKAETAAERRFESVNEFRNTLADQAANLLPRAEADARFNALSDKISGVTTALASFGGSAAGHKEGASTIWAIVGGVLGLLAFIVSLVIGISALLHQSAPIPGPAGSQTTAIPQHVQ